MPTDFEILKGAYNACEYENMALDPGNPYWVDLWADGLRGDGIQVTEQIRSKIKYSDNPQQILFTGFRGSGKTTEFLSLAEKLRSDGYQVILADVDDYLNLAMSVQSSDLLMVMAAAIDKHLAIGQNSVGRVLKGYWERLHTFLQTRLEPTEVSLGIPEVGNLQVAFKQDQPFRQRMNQALLARGRMSEFAVECKNFIDEATAEMRRQYPDSNGTVFILDSMEKNRGFFDEAEKVRASLQQVYLRDADLLRLPFHCVYTVPPWLAFLPEGVAMPFGRPMVLPMCKVNDRNSGQPYQKGLVIMRDLLARRFRAADIFEEPAVLDRLILASGGFPRELLRLIRDLIIKGLGQKTLPISAADANQAIDALLIGERAIFNQALTEDSLDLLACVAEKHQIYAQNAEMVHRCADLFDHHLILSYQNGEPWYDLHPLVKTAEKMKAQLSKRKSLSGPT